jgi:DNA-binding IclR family transcriptional regulator
VKNAEPSSAPRYAVPALDKGLDILEVLSSQASGMTLKQIAEALGRTMNEVFRMVNYLHYRGYIDRLEPGGIFRLSMRLFELAHRFPPTARLLEVAVPAMRVLARNVEESCHLSLLHHQQILVVAQTESPARWQFSVRMGATFSISSTASGRVILAFSPPEFTEQLLGLLPEEIGTAQELASLHRRLREIRKQGYEQISHETLQGVADISCPIFGHTNEVLAALTVPVLLGHRDQDSLQGIRENLAATAAEISQQLGALNPAVPVAEGAP